MTAVEARVRGKRTDGRRAQRNDGRSERRKRGIGSGEVLSLEAVERRRRQLWIIAGFFLLAVSFVVFLAFTDTGLSELVPDVPALRWGFLALTVAYMLYVLDQERTMKLLTRTLVQQDAVTASLESRIADLTTLTKVGRLVNSVLTIDEVVSAVLDAAFELTRARNGSLLVREDDELHVRVSTGPESAPVGATHAIGAGIVGRVAETREPEIIHGALSDGERGRRSQDRPNGSAVVVPLLAANEVHGVIALERAPDKPKFTQLDLRSIALFAEHAGTAISNAQRYEQERDTAARLADVLELRSEFVATMVHDLKSPLTAILGYLNILRKQWEALNNDQRGRALGSVEEQASRLLSMIEEILRSTSIEAGAELRREKVDVAEMVKDLVVQSQAAAHGREGVARTMTVEASGQATIEGDSEALRHVFSNLVENAVKYSPPGSPITVRVIREQDELRIDVCDRGVGIPEDEQPHVFERFRQVSGKPRSGVGLGLYIVRTLVVAHGGRVWVESAEAEGSTFSVVLPTHWTEDDGPVIPELDLAAN